MAVVLDATACNQACYNPTGAANAAENTCGGDDSISVYDLALTGHCTNNYADKQFGCICGATTNLTATECAITQPYCYQGQGQTAISCHALPMEAEYSEWEGTQILIEADYGEWEGK